MTASTGSTESTDSASAPGGSARARIGVTGLAVMGSNLARNLARHGHIVALHNRHHDKTDRLIAEHGDEGEFVRTESITDFVAALEKPRRALVMVKAGEPTDQVIEKLAEAMEPGDIIIDGGNALFTDTIRRERQLRERGLHFVGAGVSGGEVGALEGPSIMPGGSAESYESLGPLLESIAAHVDGTPCCTHIGEDGSGHFVKMVHNGIEYSDMQLIGEAYDLLRRVLGYSPGRIAEVFRYWNTGDLESYLVEITAEVLDKADPNTGEPLVDMIVDAAEQKGTGRWTVKAALDLGVPVTGIGEAVFARALSGARTQRAATRGLPGGDLPTAFDALAGRSPEDFVEDIRRALYASKVIAYAQGFDEIKAGSTEYGWDVKPVDLATIWRGGCIIRARFLNRIRDAYTDDPDLESLVLAPYFRRAIEEGLESWRRVVATAVRLGVPTPGFSSALAYYDGLRAQRLPAALTQAQRDYFGAHTYERVDAPEGKKFHILWSEGGDEVEA